MKNYLEFKMLKGAWTLFFLLTGAVLYAQDITLSGPVGCGSVGSSGTWSVPCDVTSITVEVYGGGGGAGGGGGGSSGGLFSTKGGGGAGGGGYSTITINVTPGSTFSYSAAPGGCGGDNGSDFNDGDSGSAGGTTSFSGMDDIGNSIAITANGGSGGQEGESGGDPGDGGAGGSASGGSTNTPGGSGNNGSGGSGGAGGAGAGPSGGLGGTPNSGAGASYGGGGAGGGNSDGGNGGAGGILITYVTQGSFTPEILTASASCSADGSATISNYNSAAAYSFTPSGPSVGGGGLISGMVAGTSYTTISTIGACVSPASLAFSTEVQLAQPIISVEGILEYCSGSSTTITASGGQSYVWDDPSNTNTAELSITEGTYTVIGTGASGCTGTATVVVVEVLSPTVDLGPDQEICGQALVSLDAGAGATSYNWSSGDNSQNVELGPGTHWVEVSNGACTVSDTIVVIENPYPAPQIAPSGSQTICNGGTLTLDAGSGYASYIWEPNGEQTQTISISETGSYSAYVTDTLGCDGYSDTIMVTIQNLADVVIIADGPPEICEGQSLTLDAGSGYDTYLWSNGDATQTTTVAEGDYWVTGTLGGCSFASDTFTVSISAIVFEIVESGSVLSVPGTYSSYQWFLNGNPIPGATGATYNTTTSGNYTVQVTDANGCTGLSYILEYTLPGAVNELEANLPFVVYPNPSNGHFQLEMDMNGPFTIEVLNAVGQMVYVDKTENGNRSFVNLETTGIYLIHVTIEDKSYYKRIVVE